MADNLQKDSVIHLTDSRMENVSSTFHIDRFLGSGGTAACYAVKQDARMCDGKMADGNYGVLKQFHASERRKKAFKTLPRKMNKLKELPGLFNFFPSYIRMFEDTEKNPFLFYTTDRGATLREKGAWQTDVNIILKVVADICEFVYAMHEHGYLLLDLKPENILEANTDTAGKSLRPIFFDVDTFSEDKHCIEPPHSKGFCAPEQDPDIMGNMNEETYATAASDWFACGMILLFLLGGYNAVQTIQYPLDMDEDEMDKAMVSCFCDAGNKTVNAIQYAEDFDDDECIRRVEETNADLIQGICRKSFPDDSVCQNNAHTFLVSCLHQKPDDRFNSSSKDFLKTARLMHDRTCVTAENLCNAAALFFETNHRAAVWKAEGHFLPELLPTVGAEHLPSRVSGEEGKTIALTEAIQENESVFLIGEGGIGKTTALYDLMQHGEIHGKTPIYISLMHAPQRSIGNVYKDGASSFIRRSVYRYIDSLRSLDDIYELGEGTAVTPVNTVLGKGKFCLVLDGVNEISHAVVNGKSVYQMVMDEIRYLQSELNVQIILSSRTDEPSLDGSVKRIHLLPLDDVVLQQSLGDDWDVIRQNNSLLETVRIPLFLLMYKKLKEKEDLSAQGEILHAYFHQVQSEMYTEKQHLKDIQTASENGNDVTPEMKSFVIDFILPQIALILEQRQEFMIGRREARRLVQDFLESTDQDISFLGDYGIDAFDMYQDNNDAKDISDVVADWLNTSKSDNQQVRGATKRIFSCAENLGLLIVSADNKNYSFSHQYIRDYFAAAHLMNTIRLSVFMCEEGELELAIDCMNGVLMEEPIHPEIRRLVGEALGEHRNIPYWEENKWHYGVPSEECNCTLLKKCDRSLLSRALDIYRNRFNEEGGYGLYSLIEIIKQVRGRDLRGLDLTRLDLRQISLNGYKLGECGLFADFTNAKLARSTLFDCGHKGEVICIVFSPDDKYLATGGEDGKIKIWDLNGICLQTIDAHASSVQSLDWFGNLIISSAENDFPIIWNLDTFEKTIINDIPVLMNCSVQFSPKGNYILIAEGVDPDSDPKAGYHFYIIQIIPKRTPLLLADLVFDKHSVTSREYSMDLLERYVAITRIEETYIWSVDGTDEEILRVPGNVYWLTFSKKNANNLIFRNNEGLGVYNLTNKTIHMLLIDKPYSLDEANSSMITPDEKYVFFWNSINGVSKISLLSQTLVWRTERWAMVKSTVIKSNPSGTIVAFRCRDSKIRLFDVKCNQVVTTINTSTDAEKQYHFDSDHIDQIIRSQGDIFVYRLNHSMDLLFVRGVRKATDEQSATAAYDFQPVWTLQLRDYDFRPVDIPADACILNGEVLPVVRKTAEYSRDGEIWFFSTRTGACTKKYRIQLERGDINRLMVSEDGTTAVIQYYTGKCALYNNDDIQFKKTMWNTPSLKPKAENDLEKRDDVLSEAFRGDIDWIVLSPDGNKVFSEAYFGGSELLTFENNGVQIRELTNCRKSFIRITAAAFSPDSHYLITTSNDLMETRFTLWDAETGKRLMRNLIDGFDKRPKSIKFGADATTILTVFNDYVFLDSSEHYKEAAVWQIDYQKHSAKVISHFKLSSAESDVVLWNNTIIEYCKHDIILHSIETGDVISTFHMEPGLMVDGVQFDRVQTKEDLQKEYDSAFQRLLEIENDIYAEEERVHLKKKAIELMKKIDYYGMEQIAWIDADNEETSASSDKAAIDPIQRNIRKHIDALVKKQRVKEGRIDLYRENRMFTDNDISILRQYGAII